MPREVVVARAEEIPPGSRKLVNVGGRSIGVFNVGGCFYALRNSCPHQGAELCLGRQFAPLRSSAPGSYEREAEPTIIRCPWHGWEFDIRTGRSWCDPETQRVRSYPARLREHGDGHELSTAQSPTGELCAQRYPARRAGPWVVIELGRSA